MDQGTRFVRSTNERPRNLLPLCNDIRNSRVTHTNLRHRIGNRERRWNNQPIAKQITRVITNIASIANKFLSRLPKRFLPLSDISIVFSLDIELILLIGSDGTNFNMKLQIRIKSNVRASLRRVSIFGRKLPILLILFIN